MTDKQKHLAPDFPSRLLAWYDAHARDLPWRRTKDPYRIWLSEIMLQQTQVATVVSYYNRFVARFPAVEDLAAADEEEVYKLWEGLGYYSRATRLLACARAVCRDHGGRFPKDLMAMLALPGIGSYTAGAVLSIAYGLPVPAVDGNVFRVVSRQLAEDSDIGKAATRKAYEAIVAKAMPQRAGDFTQALMELGATVCTPASPACGSCPVAAGCRAGEAGTAADFPRKAPRKKQQQEKMAVGIVSCGGRILFVKRDTEGLLASQWGLPIVDRTRETLTDYALEQLDLPLGEPRMIGTARHVFTHRVWDMEVYAAEAPFEASPEEPRALWLAPGDIEAIGVPTAFKKALALFDRHHDR